MKYVKYDLWIWEWGSMPKSCNLVVNVARVMNGNPLKGIWISRDNTDLKAQNGVTFEAQNIPKGQTFCLLFVKQSLLSEAN